MENYKENPWHLCVWIINSCTLCRDVMSQQFDELIDKQALVVWFVPYLDQIDLFAFNHNCYML